MPYYCCNSVLAASDVEADSLSFPNNCYGFENRSVNAQDIFIYRKLGSIGDEVITM